MDGGRRSEVFRGQVGEGEGKKGVTVRGACLTNVNSSPMEVIVCHARRLDHSCCTATISV